MNAREDGGIIRSRMGARNYSEREGRDRWDERRLQTSRSRSSVATASVFEWTCNF